MDARFTVEEMLLSAKARFEIYKDNAGEFRWRLRAPNSEEIAASEAYESKDGCRTGIESVKKNASEAEIADTTIIWREKRTLPAPVY